MAQQTAEQLISKTVESEPTQMQVDYFNWLETVAGVEIDHKSAQLAYVLVPVYQKSEQGVADRERRAQEREDGREAVKAERAAKREAAKAEKAQEREAGKAEREAKRAEVKAEREKVAAEKKAAREAAAAEKKAKAEAAKSGKDEEEKPKPTSRRRGKTVAAKTA